MKKIVIAIDGYSACGKSTLARQLAGKLGYTYIDSGAMYRAITLQFIRLGVALENPAAVETALQNLMLQWRSDPGNGRQQMYLNGENVESAIRGIAVAQHVSAVAAIPAVREFAVACQRTMSRDGGIVMDGRDIGTVVFPQAALKLFMTASPEIRIDRRYREALAHKEHVTREQIAANLAQRDYLDTHRAVSPLKQAPDAVLLDNSHLTQEEQLRFALNLVAEVVGQPAN